MISIIKRIGFEFSNLPSKCTEEAGTAQFNLATATYVTVVYSAV